MQYMCLHMPRWCVGTQFPPTRQALAHPPSPELLLRLKVQPLLDPAVWCGLEAAELGGLVPEGHKRTNHTRVVAKRLLLLHTGRCGEEYNQSTAEAQRFCGAQPEGFLGSPPHRGARTMQVDMPTFTSHATQHCDATICSHQECTAHTLIFSSSLARSFLMSWQELSSTAGTCA